MKANIRTAHEITRESVASHYDVFLATLGFESRSRFFAQEAFGTAAHQVAFSFPERHDLSYSENRDFFADSKFHIVQVNDAGFSAELDHQLSEARKGTVDELSVVLDISSMSRKRLALAWRTLRSAAEVGRMKVDFVYCPATYRTAPKSAPILEMGAVTPDYSGSFDTPDQPLAVVLGLGYEEDRALGVVEYLEPSSIFAFDTDNGDPRYRKLVRKANLKLWRSDAEIRHIRYDLSRPLTTLTKLESLCSGLAQDHKVILVPFGPKLFFLESLITADLVGCNIAVWRVSSGFLEEAVDAVADGNVYGLRLELATAPRLSNDALQLDADAAAH